MRQTCPCRCPRDTLSCHGNQSTVAEGGLCVCVCVNNESLDGPFSDSSTETSRVYVVFICVMNHNIMCMCTCIYLRAAFTLKVSKAGSHATHYYSHLVQALSGRIPISEGSSLSATAGLQGQLEIMRFQCICFAH